MPVSERRVLLGCTLHTYLLHEDKDTVNVNVIRFAFVIVAVPARVAIQAKGRKRCISS